MPDRFRDALPLLAWIASLVVAIVLFTAMGGGRLAAPPLTDPSRWADWAADRDAMVATVAVLRLVVLALAWYLVGVTTIGAVARVARWTAMVRVADALSVPMVRRVLQASLGVGLATSVVVASTGAALPRRPETTTTTAAAQVAEPVHDDATPMMRPVGAALDAPRMRPVADDTTPRMVPVDDREASPPPPGMRPLPDDSAEEAASPSRTPASIPDPDTTPTDPRPDAQAEDPVADGATVTVQTGDHLWSIAERHLTEVTDGTPSDHVITAYWERLIEANRDQLVDPDNPDLILPGQQFVLPDVEETA